MFQSRDLRTRLMPRAAVRRAVLETADALSERFADNPVLYIASALNQPDQQISFQFPEANSRATLHLQPRILEGVCEDDRLSARFFADKDGIAVASDQLTGNQWYGIRYDGFAEDISQIPLISWILSEALLNQWESGLNVLRSRFLADLISPQLPVFSREELSRLTFALASMKTQVQSTTITVGNAPQKCLRVHCRPGGLLSSLFQTEQNNAACTFYLRDGQLILADITGEYEGQQIRFQLEAEGNPAADPIRILYSCKEEGRDGSFTVRFSTRSTGGILAESWQISATGQALDFSYRYDPTSGTATLTTGDKEPAALVFLSKAEGFHIETNDMSRLAALVAVDFPIPDAFSRCAIDAQPGSVPEKPEFITPDAWSTEDLLTLLEGLGSLLNIPFP